MTRTFLTILLFCLAGIKMNAQAPPLIQWQKCIGGSALDGPRKIKMTRDGGFILGGYTTSNDGDISRLHDSSDMLIVKLDVSGNIEWQKCYGGSGNETATDILQTPDGGYLIAGPSSSTDGDVTGNHGSQDIWIIKINASGTIEWQQSYGGPAKDGNINAKICPSNNGGFVVLSQVNGNGGDVTGYHSAATQNRDGDFWVFKIDVSGNLVWQKCLGGTRTDYPGMVIPATGGYVITGRVDSFDGDITCGSSGTGYFWMLKLDEAGNITWQQCPTADAGAFDGKQTSDGGFIFTGGINIPGNVSNVYVIKTDAAGNKQWEHHYGGTQFDVGQSITLTTDGGYVIAGNTSTAGEVICNFRGGYDVWVIKLDNTGQQVWQKTYGGSKPDEAFSIVETPDLGFVFAAVTQSDDWDVNVTNRGGFTDIWLVKLSFPGIEILPTINIRASETLICPGKKVTFIADITDGGDSPSFQWQVNGVNTATNNDTVLLNTLADGDLVNCTLTSNSPCVTSRTVLSNTIRIQVDPRAGPSNFLQRDTVICEYSKIELKPAGTYKSYTWNTSAVTPTLIISQPGTYWLDVMTNDDCPGTDTILVTLKDGCLKGFYMPTAFTPNNDGKNDVLKPILGGTVLQYKFTIMNRWGQVVFQTADSQKGWDGKLNGVVQDGNVFIWTCMYQFSGEAVNTTKGTVAIIR